MQLKQLLIKILTLPMSITMYLAGLSELPLADDFTSQAQVSLFFYIY